MPTIADQLVATEMSGMFRKDLFIGHHPHSIGHQAHDHTLFAQCVGML
jgi:hypothetical protein